MGSPIENVSKCAAMACLVAAAALILSGQQPQAPTNASSKRAAKAASTARIRDIQEIVATLQSPEKAKAKATNGRKRHLSAAARKRISDAMKKKWAQRKKSA